MGYLDRFKGIVKDNYGNGRKFSSLFSIEYSYYRKVTQGKRKRGLVRWIEMFVIGYELGRSVCECEKKSDGDAVNK